ncbi:hypothetical protein KSAC_08790 [Komagataeibacter saccharivorans]|nr:hypothetical protein KSAC_08790 [Komagataeibacter saccharivorans]
MFLTRRTGLALVRSTMRSRRAVQLGMVQFLAVLPALTRTRQTEEMDTVFHCRQGQANPARNFGMLQAFGQQRHQFGPRRIPVNPRGHQVFTDEYLT